MKSSFFIPTFIILILGTFSLNTLHAQHVSSGSIMLGGSLGFESTSVQNSDDNLNRLTISPNVGYFPLDNLGLGLNLGIISSTQGEFKTTQTFIGPFARYYVFEGLFPQVQYLWEKIDFDGIDETLSGFDFTIGYTAFLNSSIALEPTIFYRTSDEYDSFGLKIGVQVFLGREVGE